MHLLHFLWANSKQLCYLKITIIFIQSKTTQKHAATGTNENYYSKISNKDQKNVVESLKS